MQQCVQLVQQHLRCAAAAPTALHQFVSAARCNCTKRNAKLLLKMGALESNLPHMNTFYLA